MLPYMLERIHTFKFSFGKREGGLKEVWNNNVWVTTAGMLTLAPLACMIRVIKIERILFSVDYFFAKNGDGLEFIENLQKSGRVSEKELEMIAYRSAEKLSGIKV
jgi:hypothetical protein